MEDPRIWRAGEEEPEPKEEVESEERQDEKPDINLEAEHNKN